MDEYVSWVLRYVPNAFRGEFINIGVLVGGSDNDWALKYVSDFRRASSLGGDAQKLLPLLQDLANRVSPKNRQSQLDTSGVVFPIESLSVEDVERARVHKNNALQLSAPSLSYAESSEQLVQILFENYVVEQSTSHGRQKLTIIRDHYREALEKVELGDSRQWSSKVKARAGDGEVDNFDFAIYSPHTVDQLTLAINFQRGEERELRKTVHAFQFRLQQIRDSGAQINIGGSKGATLPFASEGKLFVVHNEPETTWQKKTLENAIRFWGEHDIEHRSHEEIDQTPRLALAS
ncbi:DUF3037 domain-containing protein [Enteractinococcus helveticum]|uniref:DUF3037 domain-containing protein n=1 Tax=Enteractinococcus helveticum TaxID=1837282 RepID=A0A1B7M0L8_9MICC|nr:DUF3037 domain-containing protein [Enteractinococcus helveticum]OAV61781.1 hypothetical protein A6F49_07760 [Enteractinococcus helveticum]